MNNICILLNLIVCGSRNTNNEINKFIFKYTDNKMQLNKIIKEVNRCFKINSKFKNTNVVFSHEQKEYKEIE